jgi:hypothetical protein
MVVDGQVTAESESTSAGTQPVVRSPPHVGSSVQVDPPSMVVAMAPPPSVS